MVGSCSESCSLSKLPQSDLLDPELHWLAASAGRVPIFKPSGMAYEALWFFLGNNALWLRVKQVPCPVPLSPEGSLASHSYLFIIRLLHGVLSLLTQGLFVAISSKRLTFDSTLLLGKKF